MGRNRKIPHFFEYKEFIIGTSIMPLHGSPAYLSAPKDDPKLARLTYFPFNHKRGENFAENLKKHMDAVKSKMEEYSRRGFTTYPLMKTQKTSRKIHL